MGGDLSEGPQEKDTEEKKEKDEKDGKDGEEVGPPLPLKQVLALCFIQMCDFINGGAIYPYIIFLVQSFHITDDERRLGYYAGFLASSYFFAQLLSSLVWGLASDRFGRRPCMLFGLSASMATVLLFGFSNSLLWAISTRFLSGLLNGNVGITKTMLGEISTTATQARAFSYFGATVGVSGIVGPLVGGTLANPIAKYPNVFSGIYLFEKYPFCLPNLVVGSLSFIGLIIGYFILPETKAWSAGPRESLGLIATLKEKLNLVKKSPKFVKLQDLSLVETGSDGDTNGETPSETPDGADQPFEETKPSKWMLLRDRGVLISCMMYAILGLMFVFFDEVTPYWSFLEVDNGGLGFSSTDIGIVSSCGSIMGIIFQVLVYPRIAKHMGVLKAFRLGALFTIPGLLVLPQTPAIALALTSDKDLSTSPVSWAFLLLAYMFVQIGAELLFVSVMIAISNSALPEMMGTVNGIAQTIVACTRTVAPIAGGSLLSWALTSGLPFPFNQQFPFIVLVLFSLSLLGLTVIAPTDLNIQKKEALQKEKEKEQLLP